MFFFRKDHVLKKQDVCYQSLCFRVQMSLLLSIFSVFTGFVRRHRRRRLSARPPCDIRGRRVQTAALLLRRPVTRRGT